MHYMTADERQQLAALRNRKIPVTEIARQLGFSRQTIYNELRLGSYDHTLPDYRSECRYSPEKAEQLHAIRQSIKGRPLKIGHDYAYAEYLERLITGTDQHGHTDKRKRYSPAAALAEAKKAGYQTRICRTTLYSYIAKGVFLHLTNKDLWQKPRIKHKKKVQRIAHPALPSITNRPEYIATREEPGHCEMDLIVSAKPDKSAILTIAERTGRYIVMRKIPDKTSASVQAALKSVLKELPQIKSITTDNGSEFLKFEELQAIVKCPIYYCHSYAAWEKGTNENSNRMIRRWFPKGTNFAKVSKKEIAACQKWLNNYPRKCLDWLTPEEFKAAWCA